MSSFRQLDPLTKAFVWLNLSAVSFWAPPGAAYGLAILSVFFLTKWHRKGDLVVSPMFLLVVSVASMITVIFDGSRAEVVKAGEVTARVVAIMGVSACLGYLLTPEDLRVLGARLLLPPSGVNLLSAVVLYPTVAMHSFSEVLLAQRSRGFELNLRGVLSLRSYGAILVPFVVVVLRSAQSIWVSINLRPLDASDISNPYQVRLADLLTMAASLLFWLSPA